MEGRKGCDNGQISGRLELQVGKDRLYAVVHHKCGREVWLGSWKRHKMMPTHLMAIVVIDGNVWQRDKLGHTNIRRR